MAQIFKKMQNVVSKRYAAIGVDFFFKDGFKVITVD